jgi:hypothetical protein
MNPSSPAQSITTHKQIAQLERRTHVGPENRFPHFERMLLFALAHYSRKLR